MSRRRGAGSFRGKTRGKSPGPPFVSCYHVLALELRTFSVIILHLILKSGIAHQRNSILQIGKTEAHDADLLRFLNESSVELGFQPSSASFTRLGQQGEAKSWLQEEDS